MKLNSSLKQKFLRTVISGALIAGLLPVTNAFAVSAFPTSGSCAMLVTQPVPVGATFGLMNSGYNILAIITFSSATTATITFHGTRVDYTANGPMANAIHPTEANVAVTIAPLVAPAPTDGRKISFSPASGGTLIANAIAVNGGSTILIQGESEAFGGVCQF